ncbi:hypothetical protein GFS24_07705 [Chitinophaga sp. SYP-B3965]|uniref:hypothetical protein n=1 Tax=Chitinophaga sp. SYP-B3965 TaxID=2663120 RepID=UPI00129960A9|nr:hypothetical protein [Chitinophaga sp. SYP-B3965]MRG44994.1 hypothetical protein [Chitinophaga sp. SYP-B3965]
MARQAGPNFYIGRLGDKIGYKIGDIYYERKMPIKVNRSEATKKAALDFGMASKLGKLLRNALLPKLDIPADNTVTNRLNQTLAPIIKLANFSALLEAFNFNTHTPLEKLLRQKPTLQKKRGGTLLLQIPAQTISKSRNTTHIEIKAMAVSVNFDKQKHATLKEEILLIDVKKPFTGATFPFPAPGKDVTLYMLQVRALELVNGKYYNMENRKYYAAEIIAGR